MLVEIITLAREAMREKGAADAKALAAQAVSGEADGTALIEGEDRIPTWRPRAFNTAETPVGTPYKWQGQVYKLWQQHDAAGQEEWSPDKAVSLWDICHTTDPALAKTYTAPQGSRGLYQPDECCVWDGDVWKCVLANLAWSPAEYPAGWECVETN